MPGNGPKSFPCILCNKRTKKGNRRSISIAHKEYLSKIFFIEVKDGDVSCGKCYMVFKKSKTNTSISESVESSQTSIDPEYHPPPPKKPCLLSPKNIALQLSSSGNSHSTCIICKRRGPKLVVIPQETRYRIFLEKGHIILPGTRCCPKHFRYDNILDEESMSSVQSNDGQTLFNRTDLLHLIQNVRDIALHNERRRIDFADISSLSDSDYVSLTGLSKTDFDELCQHVANLNSSKNRTPRECLALLLVKLRTGLSNRFLSTIFNIGKYSIRRAVHSAREALVQNFVPIHLGFQHISRKSVIEKHTRPLAQELFGNIANPPVILVIDGTYIYIQKSGNFGFQRRSYSMHKNRPLVKPMLFVTTTGYIVSVMGPYLADGKNNDANILKHAVKGNIEDMRSWLEEDDVFVVDRGFRDSLDILDELGIRHEMHVFLKRGEKQLSTKDANETRLVTKVRWVVESANGRLKQWKYISNIVPNSQIPFIGDFVKIVAALCNRYKPPLNNPQMQADEDQILAAKMKVLSRDKNMLMQRVIDEDLTSRKSTWKKMDDKTAAPHFPILTENELRDITLGVYQLKLAESYTQEHLHDGEYSMMVDESLNDIIRVRIQSRHTASKTYLLWIQYNDIRVKAWYCQCRSGARVVGTCAHISSVLWYLGFGRHQENIKGVRQWAEYVEDAAIPILMDESDEDDEPVAPEE